MIIKKLTTIDERYREIEQMLTLPEVISNNKEYQKLIKEYKYLEPIVDKFREYKLAEKNVTDSEEMMHDPSLDGELRALAESAQLPEDIRNKIVSLAELIRQ